MIKNTLIFLMLTIFAGAGWTAEASKMSKHENIGIGGGAAIGAAAGGPVGLVLGAALGAWLGDRFDAEHTARVDFEDRWTEAEAEVAALNDLVRSSEQHAAVLESRLGRQTREMRDTVSDALDVQVLFKTNESNLPDETQQRLLRLAGLLARMDGTLIRIEGHADARGNAEYNEQLSAQRAVAVRDTLIKAGVPASMISVDAQGERHSVAEESDTDALAMDRRVDLTLIRSSDQARIAQK